jgi:hypothetical protein
VERVSTWAELAPLSVNVDAGEEAEATLRIRNDSDIVEEYHVDVVGDPAQWCRVEPATLRLYPQTTESVRLTFRPPRGPDPAAGPHPYGVRITLAEDSESVTVPEGNVSVAPFTDVRAELLPVTVRGWSRARQRLVVDNYGNAPLTAAVVASTRDNRVDFDIRTPSFQVPPGRAHFGTFRLRPPHLLWIGRAVSHPFSLSVQPSGSKPVDVAGTFLQTALLPSWLARLGTLLVGLIAAFVALWFLIAPTATSLATPQAPASTPVAVQQTQTAAPSTPAATTSAPAAATTSAPAQPAVAAPKAPPGVTLPAPYGWWDLTEGSGTTATDRGTGNHPMTVQGNSGWCSSKNCIDFGDGGATDLATNTPYPATGSNTSYTVSARLWMNNLPSSGNFETVVSQDGGSSNNSGFWLQSNTSCWDLAVQGASADADGCVKPVAQAWTDLVGVVDVTSGQIRLYVDGKETGSAPINSLTGANGPLRIGRAEWQGNPADSFVGAIADVEYFNTALSTKQVQLLDTQMGS